MSATSRTQRQKSLRRQQELRRIESMRHEAFLATAVIEDATESLPDQPWRKRKFFLGVALLPVCLLVILTFSELLLREFKGGFWRSEGFWFFASGSLCWFCMGWLRREPGLMYVFAHEMTHALAVRLSGGRVHRIRVDHGGGFVDTDKTNTLITLSPYVVPFYTGVVFALYGLLSLFLDMHHEIPLGAGWSIKGVWVFYFLIGLTWCFHVTFTLQVLETEQSDLLHNGEFFSILLIFLINVVILATLFIAASPTVGWTHVFSSMRELLGPLLRLFF